VIDLLTHWSFVIAAVGIFALFWRAARIERRSRRRYVRRIR